LDQIEVTVGSALGGPVYLYIPVTDEVDHALSTLNDEVDLTWTGGIPMMVYTLDQSTAEDWSALNTLHAPQTILQSPGGIRLVVDTQSALQTSTPDDLLRFWDEFHTHHQDLAQEPTLRPYESQWLFDPQVGWGYANATPRRINYPKSVENQALRTDPNSTDWWLFGHELGHQFQTSDWRGGDVTEVCVNLFTMYTLNEYIYLGGEFDTLNARWTSLDHQDFEAYRWPNIDVFGKLQLYRQLIYVFGWDTYKDVFASYYNESYPRAIYGSFMDGFAIRFSLFSGYNLVPFFQQWQYPMSNEAAAVIQGFDLVEWIPPGWTP
jgi:hypothetical protein